MELKISQSVGAAELAGAGQNDELTSACNEREQIAYVAGIPRAGCGRLPE